MQKIVSDIYFKKLEDCGKFCGYASVFSVKDLQGDIVEKGAFEKFLNEVNSGKKEMPMLLWQHNSEFPIGRIERLYEDEYGLYIEGEILRSVPKGEESYNLIKNNVLNGLSIGYKVAKSVKIPGGRKLLELILFEVSLVTFAANNKAIVTEVKSFENDGGEMNNQEINNDNNILNKLENFSQILDKTERRLSSLEVKNQRPSIGSADNMEFLEEKKAFHEYITSGVMDYDKKSLNSLEGQNGGYLIPEPIAKKISKVLNSESILRKISSSVSISSSSIDILIDKDIANAGWATDEETREEHKNSKLIKIKIPVYEMYSRTKATSKLLEDSNINVEDWIISKVVEKFSIIEDEAFINGDGENKPKGFLSYPTSEKYEWGKIQEIKTGVKGGFQVQNPADILLDMLYSLKTEYLKKACWVMSRSAASEIRKMRDKTTGRYLWQSSITKDDTQTLLGYPVYISDNMPGLKFGEASKSVAFGSFKDAYQIVDRSDIKILRDPFSVKPFVEFYITKRVGGDVVDFEAIKVLNFEE